MKPILGCLLISCTFAGSLIADDWDANDDTFDPKIKSVVIGDRSWIGDPSPFVHTGLSRTGYTHVNVTNFQGFPPSVQISLMVPLVAGETRPPAGGMLMLDKAQTAKVIEVLKDAVKDGQQDPQKRVQLKTSLEQADWVLVYGTGKGQRCLQWENKTKDKTDTYQFSINASKKLLGAIEHSLKSLESKAEN
jgi:hypothetical protein